MAIKTTRIIITGIVQGVGFRPFLFRTITKFDPNIRGTIRNSGNLGVILDLALEQGQPQWIQLMERIEENRPEMAFVEKIYQDQMPEETKNKLSIMNNLKIVKSDDLTGKSVVLPPDIGMCEDCLEEFKVKGDPRWGNYEFISCVKCGPRFTIMESLPYDRKRSTMEDFPFCEECNQDYHNFDDRRFHAQTFGCRYCGPFYYIHQGKKPPRYPEPHQIDELIEVLRNGKIAAVKGIGGVNLICRADKVKTIQRLRKKKKERLYKPFAVMVPDISTAKKYCKIEAKNQKWLKSWRRPIVLCPKKAHKSKKFNPKRDEKKENLPDLIAPGLPNIGIILPYMGIHYRIFKKLGNIPLIFTSGNISHLPIAIKNENIVRHLENIADIFYLHNRKIAQRCDDSVIRPVLGVPTPIRRSRGYVPEYIKLPFKTKKNVIVSVGAELNSTGAVSKGNRVFPTQHIGNVRNLETYEFLENSIMHMRKLLKIKDEDIGIIVRDTHPTFQSSKLAQKMKRKFSETGKTDIPIRTVDHHHAHLASLMVDRKLRLKEQIIAITVDGIGFGGDTEPWGGEILRGGYKKYERIGHLRRVPMVGGDLCAKNPARMLLCVLLANPQPRRTNIEQNKHTLKRDYQAQSEKVQKYIEREELWEQFPRKKIEMGYIIKELEKFQNQSHHIPASTDDSKNKSPKQTIARKYPLTSSFGRILDAISSLFGVCQKRTYRGEPAMRLEGYIWKIKSDSFFDLDNYYTKKGVILGDTLIWDYFNLLYTQERFQTEAQKKILARSLVEDLAYLFAKVAIQEAKKSDYINKIGVSGGVAYNEIIMEIIKEEVEKSGYTFLQHKKIPCGDAGTSIGQIAVASVHELEKSE